MAWIALKMLTGDRAKFFGILFGLAFATLLITQQGAIFLGIMSRTTGQIYDITGVDLWVMDANVRFVDDVKPMLENDLYRVRGVDGVRWAVPLYKGIGRAKLNSEQLDEQDNPVFQDKGPSPLRDERGEPIRRRYTIQYAGRPGGMRRAVLDEQGNPVFLCNVEPGVRFRLLSGGPNQPVLDESFDPILVSERDPKDVRPVQKIRHEVIEQVILLGLDDATLVGAPPPTRILVGSLEALHRPDAILVDYTRLKKLYPGEPWHLEPRMPRWGFLADLKEGIHNALIDRGLRSSSTRRDWRAEFRRRQADFYRRFVGRELEMNDHRAVIVGICEATRTFQSNAVAYTTYSRAKLFVPRERKVLSYVLARSDPGVEPAVVADRIRRQTGLKARSSQDFKWDTYRYYIQYTGIPINFGTSVLLGFLVGTAIAGQTFYMFTVENLTQFGALKAMGATNLRIVGMIMLQAMVVGLLGYGLGVGLAAFFGEATRGSELAFFMPWQLLPIAAAAVLLICVLSSILSVRRVIVLEPAIVFRG